jgi:Fungal protein kinase
LVLPLIFLQGTYDFMAVEVEAGAYINQAGVFSHNPLHDLESLWWVGLWFILCHYRPSNSSPGTVPKHIKVVKKFSETLFNNRSDPLSRRHALTGSTLLANTKPHSFPDGVKYLIIILEMFRELLVAYYKRYKPKESQDRSFFNPNVHRKFGDVLQDAMKELKNDQTELWPMDLIKSA